MGRATEQDAAVRRRVIAAVRVALSTGGSITDKLIADVCSQCGLHPHAFRVRFPTDDALLDAVHDVIVEESGERLRGGVARFESNGGLTRFVEASVALAESWPLDRSGVIIRANRRLRALEGNDSGERVVVAERRFAQALGEALSDVIAKLGRRFCWPTALAVRVILDTYERSFEAWVLAGNEESAFPSSPYVQRTLPTLLHELSTDHVTQQIEVH